ncbi:MAG TPA: hypothetical protein VE028_01535 [Nitratidesulfovibrio sp.]|nr:hypothetical protein [Nitratidesulfovibrio sp.]
MKLDEFRPIPGAPMYLVSRNGFIRRADTGYWLSGVGRKVVLLVNGQKMRVDRDEMAALAFADDAEEHATPEPEDDGHDADRTIAELRRQVRELSEELERYTAPAVF